MLKATLVEVNKWSYTERRNWLECEDVEEFDYIDEEKNEFYKQLFLRREDASDFIKKITEGFNQYWFNIIHSIDDDEETLEYHNGTEWDTEIHITIGNMRIDDSFIESIKSYESGTSKQMGNVMELTGWEIGYLRRLILSKKHKNEELNETDEILLNKLQKYRDDMIIRSHEYFQKLNNQKDGS